MYSFVVASFVVAFQLHIFAAFCSLFASHRHVIGNNSTVPRSVTIRQTSTALWLFWLLSYKEVCSLLQARNCRPPEQISAPSSVIIFHEHTCLIGFWRIQQFFVFTTIFLLTNVFAAGQSTSLNCLVTLQWFVNYYDNSHLRPRDFRATTGLYGVTTIKP